MARKNLKTENRRTKHPLGTFLFFVLFAATSAVVGYRFLGRFSEVSFPAMVVGTEMEVSATSRGIIREIHVETNTAVKAGEVLAVLQDEALEAQIRAASEEIVKIRQSLDRARSDTALFLKALSIREKRTETEMETKTLGMEIADLEREIASASGILALSRNRLQRAEDLFSQEALSLYELEQRRFETAEWENKLLALQSEKRIKESSLDSLTRLLSLYQEQEIKLRDETDRYITDLELSLQKKEGELKTLLAKKQSMVLRAEKPGIVTRVSRTVGETANAGDPILRISTGEKIWVETYLTSEKVDRIREGDSVIVEVDSGRRVRLPARVRGILPVMQSQPGYRPGPFAESTEKVAVVLVEFQDPESARRFVRPGQRVRTVLYSPQGK